MFLLLGIIIFLLATYIKLGKKINFISGLDKSKLKKKEDIKMVADKYSLGIAFMGVACCITELLRFFLGSVGLVIGMILVFVSSTNVSRISSELKSYKPSKKAKK